MKIAGERIITDFIKGHANSKGPLEAWAAEVRRATWKDSHDIKKRYPQTSFLPSNTVIFDIKGNTYRLVVKMTYKEGVAFIKWIGTHAEYDKVSFRGGYK